MTGFILNGFLSGDVTVIKVSSVTDADGITSSVNSHSPALSLETEQKKKLLVFFVRIQIKPYEMSNGGISVAMEPYGFPAGTKTFFSGRANEKINLALLVDEKIKTELI